MMRTLLRWLGPPVLLAGLAGAVFGFSRWTIDPELQTRNAELRAELARVRAQNEQLAAQAGELREAIRRLRSDPDESLHHARTGLGMVRGDEVVYRFVPAGERGATP